MMRALVTGLRFATRNWRFGLVLWLVGVGFAAVFAWVSGTWLAESLDGALATRTLLQDLDAGVLVDLLYHHWESLRTVLVAGAVMVGFDVILWCWLHAALVVAVQERGAPRVSAAFLRGVELAPLMARLLVIAAVVLALFTFVVGAATWWVVRATFAWPSEMITYEAVAAGAAVWGLGYVGLVAIHDHARLRAGATRVRALSAYGWAVRFVLAGGENAYLLGCALQFIAAAAWIGGQLLGMVMPRGSVLALGALFVWGEAALLLRMWIRVWFFAAQNDLQSLV